jgi:hypothetical protein
MRTKCVMVALTVAFASALAACQSAAPQQRVASASNSYVGPVESPENCPWDDGGFGAPVRHFGETTPGSENPFLNPCWPN